MSSIKISFLVLLGIVIGCKARSAFLINRSPAVGASVAKPGDIILSSSRIQVMDKGKRLVFSRWRFSSADQKNLYLIYEESYTRQKDKPDLLDKKKFPLAESVDLNEFQLNIYRLTPKEMIYKIVRK